MLMLELKRGERIEWVSFISVGFCFFYNVGEPEGMVLSVCRVSRHTVVSLLRRLVIPGSPPPFSM